MDKEDLIAIIKAYGDFKKLDNIVMQFSEEGISDEEFRGLWELTDVLRKYSKLEDYDKIIELAGDVNLSAEQKYELIIGR